jgi:hypothetical protein
LDGGRSAPTQDAEAVGVEGLGEGRNMRHVLIRRAKSDPGGKLALPGRDPCPRNLQGGEIHGRQPCGRPLGGGEASIRRARSITQQTLRGYKSFFRVVTTCRTAPGMPPARMNVRLDVTFYDGSRTCGASGW